MKCGKILINNGQTVLAFIRMRKWMFLYLLFLLAGCERRELTYYNTAEITLTVDWSQSGLNNSEEAAYGASAIFYPGDGGESKIFLLGNYSQETVRLQQGVYNVIVFNRSFTDFSNIAFRVVTGMKRWKPTTKRRKHGQRERKAYIPSLPLRKTGSGNGDRLCRDTRYARQLHTDNHHWQSGIPNCGRQRKPYSAPHSAETHFRSSNVNPRERTEQYPFRRLPTGRYIGICVSCYGRGVGTEHIAGVCTYQSGVR